MSKLDELLKLGVQQPESEKLLGITLIDAKDGQSHCSWDVTPKLMNGNGVTLGGFVTSAADIGMAYALLSVVSMDMSFTTISINTSFHRPTLVGEVSIQTKIKRLGKTTAYLESELYQNDKLIADVTSTVMLLKATEK